MRFTDEQKELLLKLSDDKDDRNAQTELYMSCGKVVEIRYVKHSDSSQHWGNDMPVYRTHGVIVNIHPSFIYIINKNGCLEIIRTQDIRQMAEIKI